MPLSRKPIYVTASVLTLVLTAGCWAHATRPAEPGSIPVVPGHQGTLGVTHNVSDHVKAKPTHTQDHKE